MAFKKTVYSKMNFCQHLLIPMSYFVMWMKKKEMFLRMSMLLFST